MNVEHINPFVAAITSVFAKLLSCELKRGDLYVKKSFEPEYQISGVVGLSGKASGIVVLTLDRNVALRATEVLLGESFDEINADVTDAIGEITNMITGAAKCQLEQFEMSVSLPSVIVGRNHIIQFPSNAKPLCIPFECAWGPVCLQVSLMEHPQGAEPLSAHVRAAANCA